MSYYTTSDHVRLYYEVLGTRKTVILIHGLTANHRHFKKQIPEFAKHFNVTSCVAVTKDEAQHRIWSY
jgi:pimeloyl-ACP methyl ester carboxylesterase